MEEKELKEEEKLEIISLDEIIDGDDVFKSTGYSLIKITKDGVKKVLKVPIQSTGIAELVDRFEESAPKPPFIDVKATPENDIGKDYGVAKTTWIKIPNYADEKYLEAKREHDSNLGMAIVLKGLGWKIKNKEGEEVQDNSEKIRILKGMGMSGDQFTQIVSDIQNLTRWTEEERESFLG